ncbi:MAG: DUF424 family protein [archaeon]|nr:DUF424 family protein [archaeon]
MKKVPGNAELYCRTYEAQNSVVLACCDAEILGKRLVEGNYDVTIEETFYRGEPTGLDALAELLETANNINLFGEKSVGVALQKGFLSEREVITIKGVKHAIIFKV